MTFRVRTAVMALAAALLLAGTTGASASASVPASAAAADATARAAANCRPPRYPGSGYFTSLRVTRVGCRTGSSVATSHYRCRVRGGAEGRCRSRVRGYRCSERRRSVSTEFNAVVTCRRGDRRVVFSYQQNT